MKRTTLTFTKLAVVGLLLVTVSCEKANIEPEHPSRVIIKNNSNQYPLPVTFRNVNSTTPISSATFGTDIIAEWDQSSLLNSPQNSFPFAETATVTLTLDSNSSIVATFTGVRVEINQAANGRNTNYVVLNFSERRNTLPSGAYTIIVKSDPLYRPDYIYQPPTSLLRGQNNANPDNISDTAIGNLTRQ